MNDRELLELAARAAGLVDIDNETFEMWNPLNDLGDALRLLQFLGDNYAVQVTIGEGTNVELFAVDCDIYESGKDLAATMRAITRAAAEIGRTKP